MCLQVLAVVASPPLGKAQMLQLVITHAKPVSELQDMGS